MTPVFIAVAVTALVSGTMKPPSRPLLGLQTTTGVDRLGPRPKETDYLKGPNRRSLEGPVGGAGSTAADMDAGLVGTIAPPFALPDTRGALFDSAELNGKIVVLNYWAFWCDTWKAELPHLERLADERGALGFDIVAVSVDGNRYDQFRALTNDALPFPVLLDVGGKVSASYGIRHVPTVVVVDRDGVVRYTHDGYPGNEAILSAIRRLVWKGGPPPSTAAGLTE